MVVPERDSRGACSRSVFFAHPLSPTVHGYAKVSRVDDATGKPLEEAGFVPLNHLVFCEASNEEQALRTPAQVLWPFGDSNRAFLTAAKGDSVLVLRRDCGFEGWSECCAAHRRGLFPSAFLALPPESDTYAGLSQLLVGDPALELVRVLGSVVKPTMADKAGRALLDAFAASGQETRLVRACVESEVAFAQTEGTLFRRNSINSVVLGEYARSLGAEYLRLVVQPTLDKVGFGRESYEVDPAKLGPTETVRGGAANVVARCDELLERLVATAPQMPPQIAHICWTLSQAVSEKMPNARYIAVGGFVMLRFVCPVIAANMAGMAPVPPERRRGLVLISKAIINLVNDVEFGKKEAFMAVLEEPLRQSGMAKLRTFFDEACRVGAGWQAPSLAAGAAVSAGDAKSLAAAQGLLEDAALQSDVARASPALHGRLLRALAQCPPRAPSRSQSEYAELDKQFPQFDGDKAALWKEMVALNKARDQEAVLQRLLAVVASKAEKKKVAGELAQAADEARRLEQLVAAMVKK